MSRLDDAPEIIVVLGGGLLPDGAPHPSTVRRADAAAMLALARPRAAVIVSGGGKPAPEAPLMAEILEVRGVTGERVHLEDESIDTVGNAVLVAGRYLRNLPPRPLTLVTSPFHLIRAAWLFRRALPGWTIAPWPADSGPEDEPRAADESRFHAANEQLIAGIADGDLAGMLERLATRWPEYARYASRVR